MAFKTKSIIALFLNFLFAVGVIILIFGFINTLKFTAYSIVFDEYPLNQYEENCSYLRAPIEVTPDGKPVDSSYQDEQVSKCEQGLSRQRKIKQINDLTTSVGLIISGLALVALFNPKSKLTATYL